jgi:hypothetical protein
MIKNQLLMRTSLGLIPVSDDSLQIIFDNLPEKTTPELATKMLVSMCLYGIDANITQDLGQKVISFIKEDAAL